jgi:TIR domain
MQMAFYIANTEQWLDHVIDACNRSNLNPEDSIFMLVTFSSLDEQFLTFFRDKNAQISQFSGQNFHVFSPIVYRNVVDDQDWRSFRENITRAGIPVSNKPTALFFRLTKRPVASGYEPQFFAGFECPAFSKFRALLKDVVETGIAHRKDTQTLTRRLAALFMAPNLVKAPAAGGLSPSAGAKLTAPRFFISYSHADKKFVSDLYDQLRAAKVDLWLDQHELLPGMEITASVEGGLRDCDGLICVLSKNSTQSKWLSFEGTLFYASGREKTLIPVILDEQGKEEAGKFPFLRDRLFVDFSATADKAAALQHLNEAIRKTKT